MIRIDNKNTLRRLSAAHAQAKRSMRRGRGFTGSSVSLRLNVSLHTGETLRANDWALGNIKREDSFFTGYRRGWRIIPKSFDTALLGDSLLDEHRHEIELHLIQHPENHFELAVSASSDKRHAFYRTRAFPAHAIGMTLNGVMPELPALRLVPLVKYDAETKTFSVQGKPILWDDLDSEDMAFGPGVRAAGERIVAERLAGWERIQARRREKKDAIEHTDTTPA